MHHDKSQVYNASHPQAYHVEAGQQQHKCKEIASGKNRSKSRLQLQHGLYVIVMANFRVSQHILHVLSC
jgi:hypothetical protein